MDAVVFRFGARCAVENVKIACTGESRFVKATLLFFGFLVCTAKDCFTVGGVITLVCGIGGLYFGFGFNPLMGAPLLNITSLAVALIVGIVTNLIVNNGKLKSGEDEE